MINTLLINIEIQNILDRFPVKTMGLNAVGGDET